MICDLIPVDDAKTLEDDAILLKVIEAYYTSAKTRQTVNSCESNIMCLFFIKNHLCFLLLGHCLEV